VSDKILGPKRQGEEDGQQHLPGPAVPAQIFPGQPLRPITNINSDGEPMRISAGDLARTSTTGGGGTTSNFGTDSLGGNGLDRIHIGQPPLQPAYVPGPYSLNSIDPGMIPVTKNPYAEGESLEWCDMCIEVCGWPFRRLPNGHFEEKIPMPPWWPSQYRSAVSGLGVLLPFPLSNAVQSISDGVQQVWSQLNSANETLLNVGPVIDILAQRINSLLQLTGGNAAHVLFISEFIQTFRKLDIRAAWAGLGQVWTRFSSKMNFLSTGAELLSSKFCCSAKVP
jgi:hypothetical protein